MVARPDRLVGPAHTKQWVPPPFRRRPTQMQPPFSPEPRLTVKYKPGVVPASRTGSNAHSGPREVRRDGDTG